MGANALTHARQNPSDLRTDDMKAIMKKTLIIRAVAAAVAGTVSLPLAAQQLEEVLVTATKRSESLQDVPMSISVMSGRQIQNLAIDNLGELSSMIPNFTVSDTLTVSQITMRGVGSGEDRGFETPIATFKDGVYLPRNRQSRSPFFDLDRVEVLRGPQAVLFGLNSTAGAISFHGKVNRPGDEFELTLTGEYETEYSGTRLRAVAGGSIGNSLGWRLAAETLDSGDGWLANDIAGDAGEMEHDILRASLVWQPSDNFEATFRWEHSDASQEGQTTEIVNGNLNLPGDAGTPGGYEARIAQYNALAGAFGYVPFDDGGENSVFDFRGTAAEDVAFQRMHEAIDGGNYRDALGADQEIDNASLNFQWQLGDYTLSGVLGYSDYFYDAAVNISGTTEVFYFGTNYEEYEQTSGEIRLASPTGQALEWIVGMYYHDADLFTDQPNTFDVGKFYGTFLGLPEELVVAQLLGAPLLELGGADLRQNTKLFSPFVSATWNITDQFRLTGGLRYSDEEKDYQRQGSTPGSQVHLKLPDGSLGPGLGFSILNANGAAVGATNGSLSSTNTMPEVAVEWDLTENIMLFGRYAESAKSGGIATAGSVGADGLIYDDETAESFEIGMKGSFLDGRAELNVVAFTTEYQDLQVKSSSVTDAGILTVIGNAAEATADGVEIDGRWLLADWLTMGGSLAFLDASYDSYDGADCNRSRSFPTTAAGCDLSGGQLPFAADYSGNIYADLEVPITAGMKLVGNVTVSFSDSYPVQGSLEPTLIQDSWTKVAGRVGVAAMDDRWSLVVLGKNLTDEKIWAGGQPLFGYDMVYPTMPRTVTVQGTFRF